ncbi:MAG: hypothetical protein WAU53_00080 [Rhodoplanes sp.]
MHDYVGAARRCGVTPDSIVGDCTTKAIAPAFMVEAKQVVAIDLRLDVPQLPNQAAFDKDLMHRGSPATSCAAHVFPSSGSPLAGRSFIRLFQIVIQVDYIGA